MIINNKPVNFVSQNTKPTGQIIPNLKPINSSVINSGAIYSYTGMSLNAMAPLNAMVALNAITAFISDGKIGQKPKEISQYR